MGKTGCRLAPIDRHAKSRLRALQCIAGNRATGDIPAFPAQWFDGLWRALPGGRCTIAPVVLQMTDVRTRSGRFTTAGLDAQTPGVRTTRFCRTRNRTGRVRAAQPLTGQTRPAIACAPMHSTSTATRPTYRDDRETPLILGSGWQSYTIFPNFGQSEFLKSSSCSRVEQQLPPSSVLGGAPRRCD